MEIIILILLLILILPAVKNDEEDEKSLTTPEHLKRYRWSAERICNAVERKLDYSKILDKPLKEDKSNLVREKKKKPKRITHEEEDPFADLWK